MKNNFVSLLVLIPTLLCSNEVCSKISVSQLQDNIVALLSERALERLAYEEIFASGGESSFRRGLQVFAAENDIRLDELSDSDFRELSLRIKLRALRDVLSKQANSQNEKLRELPFDLEIPIRTVTLNQVIDVLNKDLSQHGYEIREVSKYGDTYISGPVLKASDWYLALNYLSAIYGFRYYLSDDGVIEIVMKGSLVFGEEGFVIKKNPEVTVDDGNLTSGSQTIDDPVHYTRSTSENSSPSDSSEEWGSFFD